jgi:hypothetical protein
VDIDYLLLLLSVISKVLEIFKLLKNEKKKPVGFKRKKRQLLVAEVSAATGTFYFSLYTSLSQKIVLILSL